MADPRISMPSGGASLREQVSLGWAFVERQTNLWKRHWAWEVVWLVYGVVNTLAVTFIAKQLADEGIVTGEQANELVLFLLIGTLVWAYLSAILDDISLVVTWERWEGTIEHTLMAPVPRVAHLLGTAVFGVAARVRAYVARSCSSRCRSSTSTCRRRTGAPRSSSCWSGACRSSGSASSRACCRWCTRSAASSCRSWCRRRCCSCQASTTPSRCFRRGSRCSRGCRRRRTCSRVCAAAIIDGAGISDVGGQLLALVGFAIVLVPLSIVVFSAAERWAKRTGRLKRQG